MICGFLGAQSRVRIQHQRAKELPERHCGPTCSKTNAPHIAFRQRPARTAIPGTSLALAVAVRLVGGAKNPSPPEENVMRQTSELVSFAVFAIAGSSCSSPLTPP